MKKIQPDSHASLLAGFQRQAFATVPCLLPSNTIPDAVEQFFAFLALPQETKDPLFYKHTDSRRGGRAGYKRSEPTTQKPESKEVVQFHPSMRLQFENEMQDIPEFGALLESMEQIYVAGRSIVQNVVRGFERDSPGITARYIPEHGHPFFHLRFLKYDRHPRETHPFMAIGHYDMGSLTVAFAESAPGLRIGGDLGTPLVEITHREGQAIVMPGYNFPAEVPEQNIVSAWHDVIQKPEHTLSDTVARWAIVLFADTIQSTSASWEETHTRRGTAPPEQRERLA